MKSEDNFSVSAAPIRVLRLVPRLNTEGPVRHVALLASAMSGKFQTTIAAAPCLPSETDGRYMLEQHQAKMLLCELDDRNAFRALLERVQPHIVHTHSIYGNASHRLWTRQYSNALIVHTYHGHAFHGHFDAEVSARLLEEERAANDATDHIVCISKLQQQEITQLYKVAPIEKTSGLPIGLDTDHFHREHDALHLLTDPMGAFPKDHHVLILGRLTAVKNHTLFIESIKMAAGQLPAHCHAWIVGDGELRTAIQQQIEMSNSAKCTFHWLPWQKDVRNLLKRADVLVCASHNEGTPLSMLEAMSMEVPVVSTAVGGVPDLLGNNERGLLVENNACAMSEGILNALQHRPAAQARAHEARVHVVANYSHHRLVDEMQQLYQRLLKR